MTPKNKSLYVGMGLFVLTILAILFRERPQSDIKVVWIVWAFFSWNFYAYGFDRDMWPWQFEELCGKSKGRPGVREFHFWGTAVIYLLFLATMVFAD